VILRKGPGILKGIGVACGTLLSAGAIIHAKDIS